MINFSFALPVLISFFVSLVLLPFWIKKAKSIGLMWKDMNKIGEREVAGSGGLIAVLAFIVGVLVFVAFQTFVLRTSEFLIEILASLVVIFFLAGIGLIDDLFGWQKGGLRRRHRILLIALAAIPLMAINAGKSGVSIPLVGSVELGIIYPLVLIPLGIVGAAATFNFLAGFNGLEAGQGMIILTAIAIVSAFTGNLWLAIINLIFVFALLGFMFYNFNPAKVFPGDSLTYAVGGMIAISAILGNFEKIAVFFFIPHIMETVLKSRGKLVKQSFGIPQKNGELEKPYGKVYGVTHLSLVVLEKMGVRKTETNVVILIWLFQIIIVILGFLIFWRGIFG